MNIERLLDWRFWLKYVLLAMAAALPVAFYLRTYDSVTIKYTMMQFGALAALTAWLLGGLAEGRFELPRRLLPFLLPAVALLAWNALRFFTSPYQTAALPGFLTQEIFLVSYLLALLGLGAGDLRRILAAAAGAWGVAVVYGLLQRFGLDPFVWKGAFGDNVFSTLGNPGFFAAYLAAMAPVPLMLAADAELSRPLRAAALVLSVLGGAAVAFTGATAELLVYLLSLGAFGALALARLSAEEKRPVLLGALLSGAVCLGVFYAAAPAPDLWSSTGAQARLIRAAAGRMAADHWLVGVGPGAFRVHYPAYRESAQILGHGKHNIQTEHAASEPLEQLAEGGLVGLALWLWLFGAALWGGFTAAGRGVHGGYVAALVVSVSAALAASLVALNVPRTPSFGWFMYLGAALLALLAARGGDGRVLALPVPFAGLRLALAALVAGGAIWAGGSFADIFASDIRHNLAIFYSKRGDWALALEVYAKERPGAPSYLMAQYFIGNVYADRGRDGDLELAAQQYRKVRLLAPDYVEVHYREGVALKKLGRYAEAVERMERQVALDPVWPEAWRELAWLYAESGDKAKADEAGRRAVEAEAAWGRTRASS
ncbi:MAG: O-antigen ligase family protein [Elusimicrobiales bacterium]